MINIEREPPKDKEASEAREIIREVKVFKPSAKTEVKAIKPVVEKKQTVD